jgi:hypothetical protein
MTDPHNESVIGQLQPFTWSTEESVAYEAAIEAINGAVGAYSALVAAERAKKKPDPQVIATARSGQMECARWRAQLDPQDHAAVAETRRHFSQLAQQVRDCRGR